MSRRVKTVIIVALTIILTAFIFLPLTKGALGKHVRQFRKLSDLGKRLYACFISHLVTIHPDGPDTDCLRSTYVVV